DGDGPVTTGTPISILIDNEDQRSKDYGEIARAYRPGHADFTYQAKYGVRDPRGGGRSSARETAMRVAAGAVARKVLGDRIRIRAGVVQLGPHRIAPDAVDFDAVYDNALFAASAAVVPEWEAYLDGVRKAGSSIGAVVALEVTGVPAGWGAPLYGKLDAELAAAMMSINAVKGVEIGAGFDSAALSGEENADQMRLGDDGQPVFLSNHAGGVLGGISTGQPLTARVAFKPTSSILTLRQTVTRDGAETDLRTKGRHDPCVALRGVPVVEAMAACVLADAMLRHRAQVG
ncbi:MAG: chorismate synthase, partial [Brevundimonas sp.]